jgi:anti-sigma-K factor RskA
MSTSIRYQNPQLCDYLASQYVAGDMTVRVRARTETLAQSIPLLSNAIGQWSDDFIPLQEALYKTSSQQIDAITKSSRDVWPLIEQQVTPLAKSINIPLEQNKGVAYQLWNTLLLWRAMAGVTSLASVFMISILWFAAPTQNLVVTGPSYLAAMSSHGDANQPAEFVISVYAKNTTSPSTLHIQWIKEQQPTQHPLLHLWSENKDTGAVEYIGLQNLDTASIELTKPLWMSIANSSRLFMTKKKQQPSEENIVFSGLCLQLQAWQS